MFRQGEYRVALAAYDYALKIDPEFLKAHANRGRVLVELGKVNEGIVELTKATQANPFDFLSWVLLCRATGAQAVQTGDQKLAESALSMIHQLLLKFPRWSQLKIEEGVLEAVLHRDDEAMQSWDQALELGAQKTNVFVERARFHAQRGQLNDAMTELTKAIEHDPEISSLYVQRANVYSLLNDKTAMTRDLSMARSLKTPVPSILLPIAD